MISPGLLGVDQVQFLAANKMCESCQLLVGKLLTGKHSLGELGNCRVCCHLFFKKCTCGASQNPFHIKIG